MYQLRFFLSLFFVVAAMYCVVAWAFEFQPLLAVVQLPVPAHKFPIKPLYACAGFFGLAIFAHPGWMEQRPQEERKKKPKVR
ncbi:MAG: hypothetical protein ACI8PZ_002031 [Myxococcota bacterium]|jgi:hypothetical protein